jgi:hypothetical protein
MQRGFVLCTKNLDNVGCFQCHRSWRRAIKKGQKDRERGREIVAILQGLQILKWIASFNLSQSKAHEPLIHMTISGSHFS